MQHFPPKRIYEIDCGEDRLSISCGDFVTRDGLRRSDDSKRNLGQVGGAARIADKDDLMLGRSGREKMIGTQIEYSDKVFRWDGIVTNNPTAETRIVTADQFRKENSSPSSNGSRINFRQLGIAARETTEISIHHEPANISDATIEIPRDDVLVKDSNTIIFSVCNIYFEAKKVREKR